MIMFLWKFVYKMINCVMLGFSLDLNRLMRLVNGNGRQRRLVFAHQNMQGGDMINMQNDEVINNKKLVDVETIVATIHPDILGISETKMEEKWRRACHIPGYKWELKDNSKRISVLVNGKLDYRRRKDLERDNIAAIWLEIGHKNKKSALVCNVYREWRLLDCPGSDDHPEQLDRWITLMSVLKPLVASGQEVSFYGDINLNRDKWRQIDLKRREDDDDLNSPPRPPFKPEWWQPLVDHLYEEILSEHPDFVQMINKPSWFRQTSSGPKESSLDLFFTNQPFKISSLTLVQIAKSDHKLLVAHRRSNSKIPRPTIIRKRQWSKVDYELLRTQMAMTTFAEDIISCEDIEESAARLSAVIRVHLDVQAQVKNYQVKNKFSPWVDESSKMTILRKQKLHAIWKYTKSEDDKKKYREVSNYLNSELRRKKSAYIQQKIRSTVGSHDMWEEGKNILGWTKDGGPTSLSVNGQLTSKNSEMAQAQQDFFVNKIKNHIEKIPPTNKDPLSYTRELLSEKEVPEFNMGEVDEADVILIIKNLNSSDACGPDDISTNCLKQIADLIARPLAHIINLSFQQGKFPSLWKTAKVVPLFKNNGERTEMKCYRPIALLSSLSKVMEKVVARRLTHHLEFNGLLTDKQHGYRRYRSTATCLLQLQEEILERYEKGEDTALMCFDSSAAFDTICHRILKEKLKLYGVSESAMKWFDCYLSQRFQYCEIGGKASTLTQILQGVFQGSILGPLLYILYVNCIVTLEDRNTKLALYADDTSAATKLTKNKTINQLRLKTKAAEMQAYMDCNMLRFNSDKTTLLIKTKGTNNTHGGLTIEMDSGEIQQSDVIKVLGIYLSRDEQFKEYLINSDNCMMQFLETRLKMLKLLSKHADLKARKALAEGLILSKINYCISLWGTTLTSIINKFQVFLNKVVRVVLRAKMGARLTDLYKELRWLDIWKTRDYHDIIQLNTIIHTSIPKTIADKFVPDSPHNYRTRASQKPLRLNSKTTSMNTLKQKGFVCRAAKLYANLPSVLLKHPPKRHIFKDTVKCNMTGYEMKERTFNFWIWQCMRKKPSYLTLSP